MTKQTIELIDGKTKPRDVFRINSEKYKYMSMDRDGEWHLFEKRPRLTGDKKFDRSPEYWATECMTTTHGVCRDYDDSEPVKFKIDYTGDWKDSLHERPKELKPVNNNCCGKKILVRLCSSDVWEEQILVFLLLPAIFLGYVCISCESMLRISHGYTIQDVKTQQWKFAKRCPDVTYGDEDE